MSIAWEIGSIWFQVIYATWIIKIFIGKSRLVSLESGNYLMPKVDKLKNPKVKLSLKFHIPKCNYPNKNCLMFSSYHTAEKWKAALFLCSVSYSLSSLKRVCLYLSFAKSTAEYYWKSSWSSNDIFNKTLSAVFIIINTFCFNVSKYFYEELQL